MLVGTSCPRIVQVGKPLDRGRNLGRRFLPKKIGIDGDKRVDVIDLKVQPELVGSLRKKPGIYPAYHINKEHWITLLLNGPLGAEEIHSLIEDSFN
ncbi:hypothetical protein ALP08_101904 [Pseudomonas syringae pv. pisi]|uniref:MmcQ-like protein n=1 Tax=Pseudomonas syringae pv. pisi TaxID=59510 RepID=A0A3M6DK63_PSESJ|nr:hypothetical protein ALQ44_04834 [Pseudomonas syringae pv. pisi]RMV56498.1 hypothetical protein ALP08_101904 [Pseudomonas syringae pv. pisi]